MCAICLDGFEVDEHPLILACDHVLHHQCYGTWHARQTECVRNPRRVVTVLLDAFGIPCPLCRCAAPLAYLCERVHRGKLWPHFVQKSKTVRVPADGWKYLSSE